LSACLTSIVRFIAITSGYEFTGLAADDCLAVRNDYAQSYNEAVTDWIYLITGSVSYAGAKLRVGGA
jgi:hypothetical protein